MEKATISVLGLGLMGSALARALLASGHATTVWSRSTNKVDSLVKSGAIAAANCLEAISASPIVLICITNYADTLDLLDTPEIRAVLPGRTIVQLTTGTPLEARSAEAWHRVVGSIYLDGAILGGPHSIGKPDCMVLYAGPAEAYRRTEPVLVSLGGATRHVGEAIGSAAALDFAWLSMLYGLFLGVAHGTSICAAEGVRGLYPTVFPTTPHAQWVAGIVDQGAYVNPGATLTTWRAALSMIQRQAMEAGMTCEVPDFAAGVLDRAIARGFGDEHIAAIAKVIGGKIGG